MRLGDPRHRPVDIDALVSEFTVHKSDRSNKGWLYVPFHIGLVRVALPQVEICTNQVPVAVDADAVVRIQSCSDETVIILKRLALRTLSAALPQPHSLSVKWLVVFYRHAVRQVGPNLIPALSGGRCGRGGCGCGRCGHVSGSWRTSRSCGITETRVRDICSPRWSGTKCPNTVWVS